MKHLHAVWAGLLALLWATLAAAHPMPESRVWIDTTPGGLRLTMQLPLNRLELAYGQALAERPGEVLPQQAEGLSRYLLQHVGARSGEQGWQALRPTLEVIGEGSSAELQAVMRLQAPPGADPRAPTLLYDVITHEVRTHRVQVFLRQDWATGAVGDAPLPLGELRHGANSLPVPLSAAQRGAGFLRLLKDGALHIAGGADHLLFLLTLLIVAPLLKQAGRWGESRPTREALRRVALVVTAFTLGHSITLLLGSTGTLRPPAQPVELAVALSIGVAALHAWRPLFRQGEIAMALGFGLVHGFAFSASLSGAGLTPWQHAQALLAFNLGIEAMQLLLVALAMPALLWLARSSGTAYARLRTGTAVLALGLAASWTVERLGAAPEAPPVAAGAASAAQSG